MQAAIDGGFKNVEFTLTTPGCLGNLFACIFAILINFGALLVVTNVQIALPTSARSTTEKF